MSHFDAKTGDLSPKRELLGESTIYWCLVKKLDLLPKCQSEEMKLAQLHIQDVTQTDFFKMDLMRLTFSKYLNLISGYYNIMSLVFLPSSFTESLSKKHNDVWRLAS
jgi:hypothetical protein